MNIDFRVCNKKYKYEALFEDGSVVKFGYRRMGQFHDRVLGYYEYDNHYDYKVRAIYRFALCRVVDDKGRILKDIFGTREFLDFHYLN